MRLLVVGATGGLGRLAVAEAAQRGHEVSALVRDPARASLPEPVVKMRGDVLDPASLDPAAEGREAVVCALGTPSPRQASRLLEDGTRNLVEAMKRASVPRLVCVTLRDYQVSFASLAAWQPSVPTGGQSDGLYVYASPRLG